MPRWTPFGASGTIAAMTTLKEGKGRGVPPGAGPSFETVAALMEQLDGVPPYRILLRPAPGTATEADVIAAEAAPDRKRLCELVDGVLVEKTMGFYESRIAFVLGGMLRDFLKQKNLGFASGADGMLRLWPGRVRIPDVAFFSWERLPTRQVPRDPIPDLAPDLAVEILSAGNTRQEMERKLKDYFTAGARLVWLIDPSTRTAEAYTYATEKTMVLENQALEGAGVLPGFQLRLDELFAEVDGGLGA